MYHWDAMGETGEQYKSKIPYAGNIAYIMTIIATKQQKIYSLHISRINSCFAWQT
jgi:hypothetical protein